MSKRNALDGSLENTTGISSLSQLSGTINRNNLAASPASGTFYRGDGTWATPSSIGSFGSLIINAALYYSGSGTSQELTAYSPTTYTIPVVGTSGARGLVLHNTPGNILIGSSTGAPASAAIQGKGGVTITNGSGTIAIAVTSRFTPYVVTTASTNMDWSSTYIVQYTGGVADLLLPATSPAGARIKIVGANDSFGWRITQNAGQSLRVSASSVSTVGTSGSVSSSGNRDTVYIICLTANTEWVCLTTPASAGLVVV